MNGGTEMDVREKLVELLLQEDNVCEPSDCKYCGVKGSCGYYRTADRLIANGVTVQDWIPASEPPKKYRDEYGELIPFLVCAEGTDYPFRAMYDGKTWGDGIFEITVKWWMPLPQPPKGE